MRKLSWGFHSLTASVCNLLKTGGSTNLRAISTIIVPETVDRGGSGIDSHNFVESLPWTISFMVFFDVQWMVLATELGETLVAFTTPALSAHLLPAKSCRSCRKPLFTSSRQ